MSAFRILAVVATAATLLVAAVAIGQGGSEKDRRSVGKVERADLHLPSSQAAVLARILRGFPELRISARLGITPADYRRRGSVWVYYKLRVASSTEQVRASWQAEIASGLLRSISRSRGWPGVYGHRFTLVLPNGRERFQSEGILGGTLQRKISPASKQEVRSILQGSVASAGVALVDVRFARPLGRLGVEIVVETDDAKAYVRNAIENIQEIVRPLNRSSIGARVEGTYTLVRDRRGVWVAAHGYSVRTSAGAAIINPDFG